MTKSNLITPFGGELVDLVASPEAAEELRAEAGLHAVHPDLRSGSVRPRTAGNRGLLAPRPVHVSATDLSAVVDEHEDRRGHALPEFPSRCPVDKNA